jgi:hypothetical protein
MDWLTDRERRRGYSLASDGNEVVRQAVWGFFSVASHRF